MSAAGPSAEETARAQLELDIWTPASVRLLLKEARELAPVLRKEYEELLKRKKVRFEDGTFPGDVSEQEGHEQKPEAAASCEGRKRAREEGSQEAGAGESDAAKRARRMARFGALAEPPPKPPAGCRATPIRRETAAPPQFDYPRAPATRVHCYAGGAAEQQTAPRGQHQHGSSFAGHLHAPFAPFRTPQQGKRYLAPVAAPSGSRAGGGSDAEAKRRRMQRFGTAR
eukprot:TRINITY_DN23771_c0_g1_i1.p1 TRINITY_DN23771_c0_g1~~TRINITY_DN23771_c0_g1_i1.p1  ORF type:complete len:227 (+),score=50.29 TRINITY_DN23771_c0_g1_i1:75-755(+)